MTMAEGAWPLLQGMVENALSPEHAHRALLMGIHATALKVSHPGLPQMLVMAVFVA